SRSSTPTVRYGSTTWQLVSMIVGEIRKPVPVPPPVKIWNTPSCSMSLIGGLLVGVGIGIVVVVGFFVGLFVGIVVVVSDQRTHGLGVREHHPGGFTPRLARARVEALLERRRDGLRPCVRREQVVVRPDH